MNTNKSKLADSHIKRMTTEIIANKSALLRSIS